MSSCTLEELLTLADLNVKPCLNIVLKSTNGDDMMIEVTDDDCELFINYWKAGHRTAKGETVDWGSSWEEDICHAFQLNPKDRTWFVANETFETLNDARKDIQRIFENLQPFQEAYLCQKDTH